MQVSTQEDGFDGLAEFDKRQIGRMGNAGAGEAAQNGLRLGGADA